MFVKLDRAYQIQMWGNIFFGKNDRILSGVFLRQLMKIC